MNLSKVYLSVCLCCVITSQSNEVDLHETFRITSSCSVKMIYEVKDNPPSKCQSGIIIMDDMEVLKYVHQIK